MNGRSIYREQIDDMVKMLTNQVSDVDDETLAKRPGEFLNPVGFIYWHILRIWDLDLNWTIKGGAPTEDAWHRGGYSEALGYNSDGKGGRGTGIGFGYTDAEVDELIHNGEVFARYRQQLLDETHAYLDDATDEELAREVMALGNPVSVGSRLQHTVSHSWNHIGEIRMTKSMLGFQDPTTPPRS